VRPPGFFLITERMRLFSSPHPQLSVIPHRHLAPPSFPFHAIRQATRHGKIQLN
jgi:hypothetical protein